MRTKYLPLMAFLLCSVNITAQVVTDVKTSYDVPSAHYASIADPDFYPESGTVVVNVIVLKNGSVFNAVVNEELTTVKNFAQRRESRRAAYDSKFFISDPAPADTLKGTITYCFYELSSKQLDSLQTELLYSINKGINKKSDNYVLYKTENNWTFLELDTRYGYVWQLHFSVGSGSAGGRYPVNSKDLRSDRSSANSGRFKLYRTDNMYNYILLDTIDGRTWQVQWSYEERNRGIVEQIK